jgi:hypothetical protein
MPVPRHSKENTMQVSNEGAGYDVGAIMGGLYGDGIIACKGAFSAGWVAQVKEDIETLFAEARARPRGALERGPFRYYVEVHPERLRGFVELATHPWVVAVCRAVLGPDYKIVEVGFDIPFPGAMHQPWHRDFPAPPETLVGRRLNSLAFNLTTVDVTEEIGPFEIAPGTQWDDLAGGDPMFPDQSLYPRYEARGTANRSKLSRPVLVLGVDAPDGRNADKHDLQVTQAYWDALPDAVRDHLRCRIVPALENIEQAHTIEGLRMGVTG